LPVAPVLPPNLPLPTYTPVRADGVALPSTGLPTLAPPVPPETPPGLANAVPPAGESPMGSAAGPGVAVRLGSPGAGDSPFRPATGGTGAGPGPRGSDYPDKDITVYLGGRVHFDAVDYIAPAALRRGVPGTFPLDPGVSFRRLRLDASGSIYKHIDYMVQIDFVNGLTLGPGGPRSTDVAVPTDAWVTFKDLPVVGNVRVGNHKPWYSFEHLTSSRYLNFLERSLGFDAFAEGFNNGFEPGISAFDTYLDKRGTWGVGLFKNTRTPFAFGVGHNELDVNGRVTFLPVYENDGKFLVHVGVGASHRDPDDGQVRFRSRFDARNSPSGLAALVADTGLVNASQQNLIVPELVMVAGPLSVQSEFYGSWVNDARPMIGGQTVPVGTTFFYSCYAEAHLFLTGEHRAYNRGSGVFGAVKPLRPVDWSRCGFTGCGAWQLTARYSYLNLNDKGIVGGRVNDMTLGVNWFLNQYMKVQGNYFLADRDAAGTAGDGIIHGFATRLALDF
jgi:phosphate-selective porin OprO/OprP